MNIEQLRERASRLPATPGIYIMKDGGGKVIYVGKSRALKNRVSQYFAATPRHDVKTSRMVSCVRDFEFMLTDTEIEALSLENRLIKLHQPKFNIKLKDAKSYPYVKVTVGEEYPRIVFTRQRKADGAKYFGPYSSSSAAYDIIGTARRSFGIPQCKKEFPRDIGRTRPCMYYQLGQCMAPCTGRVSAEEYRSVIHDVLSFLGGSYGEVEKSLTEKMNFASENLRFEAAARYRDRIEAVGRLRQKQKIVGTPNTEYDVFSLYTDELCSVLGVYYVREGAVTDSENIVFPAQSIVSEESLTDFLCDLYVRREYIPAKIITDFGLGSENIAFAEEFLSERAGRSVRISRPSKGRLKQLCAMVGENAAQHALEYQKQTEGDNKTLIKLAQMLSLEVVPEHIEAYDISNFGSDNITGAMIRVDAGHFNKSGYRLYKIKSTGTPDDYASMREMVSRRLAHTELPYPDLILLDGGKTHVSAVRQMLCESGIEGVPVYGMVKDSFHKTRALTSDDEEISIAREQAVFSLIYRIQEEVHRFAIKSMSAAKSKPLRRSSLEDIPGIGAKKARLLTDGAGGYRAVKTATADELSAIRGISQRDAQTVYEYFRAKENKKK